MVHEGHRRVDRRDQPQNSKQQQPSQLHASQRGDGQRDRQQARCDDRAGADIAADPQRAIKPSRPSLGRCFEADRRLEAGPPAGDQIIARIGEAGFIYAGLDLIEGTGLYLEKAWAEYLTLAITASFLPLEIFEVFRRLTWIRVGLLAVNTMVFFYLLQLVVERGRRRSITAEE